LFPRTALCFAEPSDITTLEWDENKGKKRTILLVFEALRARLFFRKNFRADDLDGDSFMILFD